MLLKMIGNSPYILMINTMIDLFLLEKKEEKRRMTTVDKAHELFMSFKGRSPRQIYVDACNGLSCKVNSGFAAALSDTVDDFYGMEELILEGNFFGNKGCLAIIPIIQCQQELKKINLANCGINDDMVTELVEVLQDHPRLRSCDLSGNKHISVYSGKGLVHAVKMNVNIIELKLDDTHIGRNVANVISQLCHKNLTTMVTYFGDDFFKMKDMFIGLDVDGSGWVNLTNVIGSVMYPMIRERLSVRIAQVKPKRRADNCVDVNTFMELVYLNYKTSAEIGEHAASTENEAAANIKSNWILLLEVLTKKQAFCPQLHKFRVRTRLLSDSDAESIVDTALGFAKEGEESAGPLVQISVQHLFRAMKELNAGSPRGYAYRSFLTSQTVPTRTWLLPPPMLRCIVDAFKDTPESGMPVSEFLEKKFETDMEWLKMTFLKEQFIKYSIPLAESLMTLQEAANLLDEQYDVIRVDKPFTIEQIKDIKV